MCTGSKQIENRAFWFWLANALGAAAPNTEEILRMYPHPKQLYEEYKSVSLSLILTKKQRDILDLTQPEDFVARLDECRHLGVQTVCFDEPDYPKLLKETPAPPPVLYYRGDITLLNQDFVFAIVGARSPSAYGVEATSKIARVLSSAGVVTVSGLASGLDSEAHKAALENHAPTVACIAFGHEHCYPAVHHQLKRDLEEKGLVIGEYPPNMPPRKESFLQRNRLIAGVSKGICVAEARKRSGTMNTVSCALAYGRDVFAVPGSIFSPLCEGTNQLIAEGAYVATCGEDILSHYHLNEMQSQPCPHKKEKNQPTQERLSEHAEKMLCRVGGIAKTFAVLCTESNLPAGVAMAALTELELAGKVRALPGRQYVLR